MFSEIKICRLRSAALVLALVLLTGLFSCGGRGEKLTGIFSASELTLPEAVSDTEFSLRFAAVGTVTEDAPEESATSDGKAESTAEASAATAKTSSGDLYLLLKKADSDLHYLAAIGSDGKSSGAELQIEVPADGSSLFYRGIAAYDDSVWLAVKISGGVDSPKNFFEVYPNISSGAESLSESAASAKTMNIGGADILSFAALGSDSVLALCADGLKVCTLDYIPFTISVPDDISPMKVIRSGGAVYVLADSDGTGNRLVRFNEKKQRLEDEITLPAGDIIPAPDGDRFDFYISDSSSVKGCNFDDRSGMKQTVLLDFMNSDIDSSTLYGLTAFNGGFVCSESMEDASVRLIGLSPSKETRRRERVTLAVLRTSAVLRSTVISFNRQSGRYHIDISDYSSYGDMAATRLGVDLSASKSPDMLLLDDSLPVSDYAKKRLLSDIYGLMEKDSGISKGDFLESVLAAYEIDGKLCSIPVKFAVKTYSASDRYISDALGQSGTLSCGALSKTMSAGGAALFPTNVSQNDFLEKYISFNYPRLIDKTAGEAHLDTETFRNALILAAGLPVESQPLMGRDDTMFSEGRVLLSEETLTGFNDIYFGLRMTFGDSGIYVGFPDAEGSGAAFFTGFAGCMEFALTEGGKNSGGAWEFLKYLLSDEKQLEMDENGNVDPSVTGFPIRKSAFERLRAAECGSKDAPVSGADADMLEKLISETSIVLRSRPKLLSIITDEASGYFSGKRELDTVVSSAQSRASTLAAE